MRSTKKYSGHVVFCKLPTLAEAMEHFQETGEFILSARDDDAYDSPSRDFDPLPTDSGEIDVVGLAASRKRDQDSRGKLKDSKNPIPDPTPAPTPDPTPDPAPSSE